MGAFITAFEKKVEAEKTQAEKEGTLYTWDELLNHLNNN
jgi:copper chaperone NosL